MFETNSILTVGVAILPNPSDNWAINSPFPGEILQNNEEYFVLSNGSVEPLQISKAHPIEGRLINVSDYSNEVNFIQKTLVDITDLTKVNETNGIGGFSNLKDFTFSISTSNMNGNVNVISQENMLRFFGRTINLYLMDTSYIVDLDSANAEVKFIGKIFRATRETNKITFSVRGKFDFERRTLSAGVSVGMGQVNPVKLEKFTDDNNDLYFKFPDSIIEEGLDNYYIKQYLIKTTTNETIDDSDTKEVLWIPTTSEGSLDEVTGHLNFESSSYTKATLAEDLLPITHEYTDPIKVNTYWVINVLLNEAILNTSMTFEAGKSYRVVTDSDETLNNYIEFITYDPSSDSYLFKAGYEIVYGFLSDKITDGNSVKIEDPYNPGTYPYTIREKSLIIKQKDPLAVEPFLVTRDDTFSRWNLKDDELKDYMRKGKAADCDLIGVFENIPEEGIVIKIDDEEMLLCYSKMNTGYGSEVGNNLPTETYIYVLRGMNGSVVAGHSKGASIKIKKNRNTKLRFRLERTLQHIKIVDSRYGSFFQNIRNFEKGTGNLKIRFTSSDVPLINTYIGLDFDFPDLKGDFIRGSLFFENTNITLPDEANLLTNPDIDYLLASINLAMNRTKGNTETSCNRDFSYGFSRRLMGRSSVPLFVSGTYNRLDAYITSKYFRNNEIRSFVGMKDFNFNVVNELLDTSFQPVNNLFLTKGDGNCYTYPDPGLQVYPKPDLAEAIPITSFSELKERDFTLVFNNAFIPTNTGTVNGMFYKSCTFEISRPIAKVHFEQEKQDITLYADMIKKTELDKFQASGWLDVGSNAKIMLDSVISDKKIRLVVSDDNLLIIAYVEVEFGAGSVSFTILTQEPVNPSEDQSGYLATFANQPIYPQHENILDDTIRPIYKYIPSTNSLYYIWEIHSGSWDINPLDFGYELDPFYDGDGLTYLKWKNYELLIDDNKLKVFDISTYTGNPVDTIRDIFESNLVPIDNGSFDSERLKRLNWDVFYQLMDEMTIRSVVDLISKNHGLIVFENNLGNMEIRALDIPVDITSLRDITDDQILVLNDSVSINEEFTDLRYLITNLDVNYNRAFEADKDFQSIIESDNLIYQDALEYARDLIDIEVQSNLNLDTIPKEITAQKSAELKTQFHYTPTRVLTIDCTMDLSDLKIGEWVTCSSSKVSDHLGKVYLVIKNGVTVPIGSQNYKDTLKLYEYNLSQIKRYIREVPLELVNTNYDETADDLNKLEEVPNV